MRFGVSNRYALWFSAISLVMLFTVLLATGILILRSSGQLRERLRQGTQQNFEAVRHATIYNLSEFLRRELFTPLYELNIEYIDRTLKDLYQGMPIISIRIADVAGKVLTDGTKENLSYGMQLRLDRKRLESTPILIEAVSGGHRVTFLIGTLEYCIGYGEIVFSDEPLRRAIVNQDETILRILREFKETFLEIAATWTFFVALLGIVISVIFSRTLSLPLLSLRDAASRIAAGDLDHRVAISSRDEIGELAAAFNGMVADLQKRTAEIAKTTRALQTEVEERRQTEQALRESEERLVLAITDLKESQLKLTTAKEAAEAANRAKSEFLANMSHEMRTPLAGALGMVTLVLEMEIGAEERQMLEMAKRSAESLLRLISDLLDFSRLEAGILVFEKKTFSIPMTVKTAIEVVSIEALEKGLRLLSTLEEAVPEQVKGDEGRLRQVLVNLLGNAVKFTERGEVEVRVSPFCDAQAPARNFLLFSVRDTGIGIPPEQQEKIFGKFVQVNSTARRKYGGTGLGLALSRQIIEIVGGEMWVESELGKGSTFYFTYPLDDAMHSTKGEGDESSGR